MLIAIHQGYGNRELCRFGRTTLLSLSRCLKTIEIGLLGLYIVSSRTGDVFTVNRIYDKEKSVDC